MINDADEWFWWMMLMNDAWVKQEPHDRSVLLVLVLDFTLITWSLTTGKYLGSEIMQIC